MRYFPKQSWPVWLAIGLLVGFVIGGLWPDTPLHAVATDRTENFAMATGFVDDGVEAIYFLDFLTGTLRAAVLSNQGAAFRNRRGANIGSSGLSGSPMAGMAKAASLGYGDQLQRQGSQQFLMQALQSALQNRQMQMQLFGQQQQMPNFWQQMGGALMGGGAQGFASMM